jgi:hypothetical protein
MTQIVLILIKLFVCVKYNFLPSTFISKMLLNNILFFKKIPDKNKNHVEVQTLNPKILWTG